MNDITLNLHWENFETNAANTFRQMWNDQDLTDVTLATVDDQQIRAHKLILSSCSKFFKNIFVKNPNMNPPLYLKDIKYKELVMVMEFIYLGQCDVEQNELQDFLVTGNYLEVEGLMKDANHKDIEEPVVKNEAHNTQEYKGLDSNYTDQYYKNSEMFPLKQAEKVIQSSNKQEGGSFICSKCKVEFDTNNGLWYHKMSKHEVLRYKCHKCDHSFTLHYELTRHKKSKHEGMNYECPHCDYKSTTQSNLTKHKQSKHEGVRYNCDQCDHTTTQRSQLIIHIQSKHEGVIYKC